MNNEPSSDESLGSEDGVLGVCGGLSLGEDTDESLSVFGEGDHGGSRSLSFGVFDHARGGSFQDCHARVGGSEIDTDGRGITTSDVVQNRPRLEAESRSGVERGLHKFQRSSEHLRKRKYFSVRNKGLAKLHNNSLFTSNIHISYRR